MVDRVENEYYVVRPTTTAGKFAVTFEVWSVAYGDCLMHTKEVCQGDADTIQAWLAQNKIEEVITEGL